MDGTGSSAPTKSYAGRFRGPLPGLKPPSRSFIPDMRSHVHIGTVLPQNRPAQCKLMDLSVTGYSAGIVVQLVCHINERVRVTPG